MTKLGNRPYTFVDVDFDNRTLVAVAKSGKRIMVTTYFSDIRNMYMCESYRQKTYLQTCAPSHDSDYAAHSRSLIILFIGRILDNQGCLFFIRKRRTLIRQRGCLALRRLIWVYNASVPCWSRKA